MARTDCAKCGGTGWRTVEVAAGARGAAAAKQAVLCDCAGDDRLERLLAAARIPKRYQDCDFTGFDTNHYDLQENGPNAPVYNQSLQQAKTIVTAFAREYPNVEESGLLLIGGCGVGKTHLAVAVLKGLIGRGHSALFCDYRELLKQIQASYNPDRQATEMEVLEPVLTAELLLLDDLGSSKPSPWALETVGHILNTRYNEKRITLITTNYLDTVPGKDSPVDIFAERAKRSGRSAEHRFPSGQPAPEYREESLSQRIGERIRSRLYEMCRTVEIYAPDYRKEIRQAGRLRP